MTDEEVTYTTVRFHKSSGLQDPVRPEETQRPREADHREYSVPWKLIVIVLGILCSLLLVTVAVLVTHIFQHEQEKHDQEKTLDNLCQEYHAMKSDRSSVEEMLRNKSLECNACKDNRPPLNREQNICYREAKIVLECSQLPGKRVEGHWFCSGMKCYYFIMDNNQWRGCVQICKAFTLSLLKIDDEDELQSYGSSFHGRACDLPSHKLWISTTTPTCGKHVTFLTWAQEGQIFVEDLSLCHLIPVGFCRFFPWFIFSDIDFQSVSLIQFHCAVHVLAGMKSVGYGEKCAFLTSFHIQDDYCTRAHGCLCEKRLRKFPIPLSCVKNRTQSALQSDEVES
ncbi:LOW QUALITY PROTEIN: killer cell lectin-like receptor 2 [Mastomys coucha]|uniref:LOW QUALITY PROTEIN: killer cell lectin-like receptor 2 n=1 Tax=Mastomys coucha TaxID=35658 RepID=UPI001261FB75|nr:LOW QUALITY PROTEIN: killer cell lectin-like receptor 2 [Mastomys coucha]